MILNLNKSTVMQLCKCSNSTAIEIMYSNLLTSKNLYLNRKNNSTATLNWLKKHFEAKISEIKNDAPRGGKVGDFITFTANEKFDNLCKLVLSENDNFIKKENERKVSQKKAVDSMVISEIEAKNFIEKTKDLSNKKARAIAHNFAGRKLGFYSNEAKDKFMNLR